MKERSITTDITTLQRIMITIMNNYIQVNWIPRKNVCIHRNTKHTKTKSGRNRKSNQTDDH